VRGWIAPAAGNVTLMSELTLVEMTSLLERHIREGSISPTNATAIQQNMLIHAQREYIVVPITSDVLRIARQMLQSHPLRKLDAIQLASAVHAVSLLNVQITFTSADTNLLSAAAGQNFSTDNPLNHP